MMFQKHRLPYDLQQRLFPWMAKPKDCSNAIAKKAVILVNANVKKLVCCAIQNAMAQTRVTTKITNYVLFLS